MAEDKSLSEALERIFMRLAEETDDTTTAATSASAGRREGQTQRKDRKLAPPLPSSRPAGHKAAADGHHSASLGAVVNASASASASAASPRSFEVGKTPPPRPRPGVLPPLQHPAASSSSPVADGDEVGSDNESPIESEDEGTSRTGRQHTTTAGGGGRRHRRRSPSNSSSQHTNASTATATQQPPTGFRLEQLQAAFAKRRGVLFDREAAARAAIVEEEMDGYEGDLLAAWVALRGAAAAERKAAEDAAHARAAQKNRENRLMHSLWSREVRHVRNAIRAEYECEFDVIVCYCRAAINTAEQRAAHRSRTEAERAAAERISGRGAEEKALGAKRMQQEERARALLRGEETEGRDFVFRLEASTVAAIADVFKTQRRALLEQETAVKGFWARHQKRQTHLQHSMDWLLAEETSRREANAKAERQRFDSMLSAHPDSFKMALQMQLVRQRAEARDRLDVEELCVKEREGIEAEHTAALAALASDERDERARTQAAIDRAERLASRRALADAHAQREKEAMFEADNASWALVRAAFEDSLDYTAAREEAYVRSELAMWKASERAFILALLRQRTSLANAAQRARLEIEAACEEGYAAITEALQASQDRFLLQWFEAIRRRLVEDEYAEASVAFTRHARTLAVSSHAAATARRSAVDKPLTNAKSRVALQLRRNLVPWFFGTDGCRVLDGATVRAAAAPAIPLPALDAVDVTLEILNPHEGDTLEYSPAGAGGGMGARRGSAFVPAAYFASMLQRQQSQTPPAGAERGGGALQRTATTASRSSPQKPSTPSKGLRGGSVTPSPSVAGTIAAYAADTETNSIATTAAGDDPLNGLTVAAGGDGVTAAADDGAFGELVEEEGDDDALSPQPVETQRRVTVRRYSGDPRALLDGFTFRNVLPFNKLKVMQRIVRVSIDTVTAHVVINVLPAIFSTPAVAVTTNVATPLGGYAAPPHREFKRLRCVLTLAADRSTTPAATLAAAAAKGGDNCDSGGGGANLLSFKLPNQYFNHPRNGILLNGRYYMRLHNKTNTLVDVEFDNTPTTDVRPLLNAIKVLRKEGAGALRPMSLAILATLRDDTVVAMHQFLDVDSSKIDAPRLRVHSLDICCRVSIGDGAITVANEALIDDIPFSLLARASVRFPDLQTQFCGGSLSVAVKNDPEGNVGLAIRPLPCERYSFEVSEGVLWATDNRFYHDADTAAVAAAAAAQQQQKDKDSSGDSAPPSGGFAMLSGALTARGGPPPSSGGGTTPSATAANTATRTAAEEAAAEGWSIFTPSTAQAMTPQAAIRAAGQLNTGHERRFPIGFAFGGGNNSGHANAPPSSGGGAVNTSTNGDVAAAHSIAHNSNSTHNNSIGGSEVMIKFREDAFFDTALIDPLLRSIGFMYRRGAAPLPLPSGKAKDKNKEKEGAASASPASEGYRLHVRLDVRADQSVDPIDATFRLGVAPCAVDVKSDAFNYKERTGLKALPTMSLRGGGGGGGGSSAAAAASSGSASGGSGSGLSHEARIVLELVDGVDEDGSDEVALMDCEPDPSNPKQSLLVSAGAPIAAVIRHSKTKVEALLLPHEAPWRRAHVGHPYPKEAFHGGDVAAGTFTSVLRSLAFQSTSNDVQFLKKLLRVTVDDGATGPTAFLVQVMIESVDDPTDIILATPEVHYRQLSRGLRARGCPLMPGVRLEDVDSDNFHGGYVSVEYATGPSTELTDSLVVLSAEQQELTIHQPEDTSAYSALFALLGSASKAQIAEAVERQQQLALGLGGSQGRGPAGSFVAGGMGMGMGAGEGSIGAGVLANGMSPRLSPATARGGGASAATAATTAAGGDTSTSLGGGGGYGAMTAEAPTPSSGGGLLPFPCLALVAEMAPQKSLNVKDGRMYYAGAPIGTVHQKRGANGNTTSLTFLFRSDSTKFVSFPAAEYAMRCVGYENAQPKILAGPRTYTVRLNCTGLKSTAETVVRVGVNVSPAMLFLPPYASTVRFDGDKPRPLLKPAIVSMPDAASLAAATAAANTTTIDSNMTPPPIPTAPSPPAILVNQGFLRLRVTNTDDWNDEIFIDESLGEGIKLREKSVMFGRETIASIVPLVNLNVNSGVPRPNYLHLSFVKMTAEGLEALAKSICFTYRSGGNGNGKQQQQQQEMQNLRSRTIEIEFSPTNGDASSVCCSQMVVEMSRKDVPYSITIPQKSMSRRLAFVQGGTAPAPLLGMDCAVTDAKGKGFAVGWVLEASVAAPARVGGGGGGGASALEFIVLSTLTSPASSTLAIRPPPLPPSSVQQRPSTSTSTGPENPSSALEIRTPRGNNNSVASFAAVQQSLGIGGPPLAATAGPYCFTIVDTSVGAGAEIPIATLYGTPMVPGGAGGGLISYATHIAQQSLLLDARPATPSAVFMGAPLSPDAAAATPSSEPSLAGAAALRCAPPLYFPSARGLFLVIEKTLSPSELKEVLTCIGYANNARADRGQAKNVNITLHRPKGGGGGATGSPSAGGGSSPQQQQQQQQSASTSPVRQLMQQQGSSDPSAAAAGLIPLVRLELSVNIFAPMLDFSLAPTALSFPWAAVAMGAAAEVPIAAGVKCDVPAEAADVAISITIVTTDAVESDPSLLSAVGGGGMASPPPMTGLATQSYVSTSGGMLTAAGGAGYKAARRASSVLMMGGSGGGGGGLPRSSLGSGQVTRTSTATSASRGVTWAIAGRRESDNNATGRQQQQQQLRSGVGGSYAPLSPTLAGGAGGVAAAAAAAAAVSAYGLALEWRPPQENPLGIALEYSTGRVYYGVSGHAAAAMNSYAPHPSSAGPARGGGVGGVRSGTQQQQQQQKDAAASTAPFGVGRGTLFGTLAIRGDSVVVTHEPLAPSAPCDSLVAQAILRCIHLVARDAEAGLAASAEGGGGGGSKRGASAPERAAVPVAVGIGCSIGANRTIVTVQL